eukprot:tig00001264_g7862.t1
MAPHAPLAAAAGDEKPDALKEDGRSAMLSLGRRHRYLVPLNSGGAGAVDSAPPDPAGVGSILEGMSTPAEPDPAAGTGSSPSARGPPRVSPPPSSARTLGHAMRSESVASELAAAPTAADALFEASGSPGPASPLTMRTLAARTSINETERARSGSPSEASSPRSAAPRRFSAVARKFLSVRVLLTVPVLAVLITSNVLVWYLGYRMAEDNLGRLTEVVKKDLLSQLEFRGYDFVDVPVDSARIIAEEFAYGRASPADPASLKTVMWATMRLHPHEISVTLGFESGLAVAYRPDNPETQNPLWGGRGYQYFVTLNGSSSDPNVPPHASFPAASPPDFVIFNADRGGNPSGRVLSRLPNYVVQRRLFYTTAAAGRRAGWTPATYASDGTLTVFFSQPLFDPSEAFLGVVGVGVQLDAFGASAKTVLESHGSSAAAFVLERSKESFLLWSSAGRVVGRLPGPNGTSVEQRLSPATSESELVRGAARELEAALGPLNRVERAVSRTVTLAGAVYVAQVFPVRRAGVDWIYVVLLDQSAQIDSVRQTTQNSGIITGAISLFAVGVSIAISVLIVNPLRVLSRKMEAIRNMRHGGTSSAASGHEESDEEGHHAASPPTPSWPRGPRLRRRRHLRPVISEFREMDDAFRAMAKGVRSFEKYVPGDYVRQLIKSKLLAKPGLTVHNATIFFADIQGFTQLTETMAPNRLVEVMSEAMEALSQRIVAASGTIDKYIGDAIMAFFSTPIQPLADHEARACEAALACQSVLAQLRPAWRQRLLPPLECRIGVDAGNVLIGNFGSSSRLNYTVLGDHVNTAARLEPLNKRYGTSVLVSERVAEGEGVRARFLLRLVDRVILKGRSKVSTVYELVGARAGATAEQEAFVGSYEGAFELYLARRFEEAAREFDLAVPKAAAALHSSPCTRDRTFADRSSSILAARCRALARAPPPEPWDGAEVLQTKFD